MPRLGRDLGPERRRWGLPGWGLCGGSGRRGAGDDREAGHEVGDGPRLPVFEELEALRREVGDGAALGVGHHHVQLHQLGLDADPRQVAAGLLLGGRGARRGLGPGGSQENGKDRGQHVIASTKRGARADQFELLDLRAFSISSFSRGWTW